MYNLEIIVFSGDYLEKCGEMSTFAKYKRHYENNNFSLSHIN